LADPEIGRVYQNTQEAMNAVGTTLLFFVLEINRIEDKALEAKLADRGAAKYRPWLRDIRLFRPHQLSDELEKILHEKDVSGRAAWTRLFDETMSGLRFRVKGKDLASQEALHLLSDKDPKTRRAAAKELGRVFEANSRFFALVTNTLAKDKAIEDSWRKFQDPAAARHLANQVEPEVVKALVEAVRGAYPRLAHRYYRLKAKWMGKKVLDYWDRNAPLPDDADRRIAWDEAKGIVLDSYRRFSPELATIGQRFFDRPWIDAAVRPGKAPGAFSHGTVPSAHPYILMNYQGRTRDVMTLAHELGHGVHQVLAAGQGALMASTPLTLAETASVFGEQLAFRALLEREKNDKRRRVMLAQKVEDMLNTVVRQIAFFTFEERVHGERKGGELTAARLGEIWMEVQRESLGPAFRFDPEYRTYWCYIPHFIHSPFYVYAYAFGDCLVNALYAVYQRAEGGFQARYLDMLRAGGSKTHGELLAPFGLDATDPAFWSAGLGVIGEFVDRLEAG
ncbi:MAG: M3 family oligoendopeptidase, partial [Alphaproteobacteria bacterium]|nr:M3 family oligoendopeptidase [Alphaproteobacteria bacterium]